MSILNLLIKIVLKSKIFFIRNNEIIESVKNLKDEKLRKAENIPLYFLKQTICSLIFTISLIFNCSLAISYQNNGKYLIFYQYTKKETETIH